MPAVSGVRVPGWFQAVIKPTNCVTMISGPGVVSARPRPSSISFSVSQPLLLAAIRRVIAPRGQVDALAETVFAIIEAIRVTLERTPPELSADIIDRGIILTGGGSLLKNLDYKIKEETGLPVALADDPLTTVAMGTGKAMMDPELLKKLAIS